MNPPDACAADLLVFIGVNLIVQLLPLVVVERGREPDEHLSGDRFGPGDPYGRGRATLLRCHRSGERQRSDQCSEHDESTRRWTEHT